MAFACGPAIQKKIKDLLRKSVQKEQRIPEGYALFFLGTGTFFLLENAAFGLYYIGKSGFSKKFTEPS